jgi:hypothetical protein
MICVHIHYEETISSRGNRLGRSITTSAFSYSICSALDILLNVKLMLMPAIFLILLNQIESTRAVICTDIFDKEVIEKNYYWRSELTLNLDTMRPRAYKLIGSYSGTLNDLIEELLSLARRGIINPLVSKRFKLGEATEALHIY